MSILKFSPSWRVLWYSEGNTFQGQFSILCLSREFSQGKSDAYSRAGVNSSLGHREEDDLCSHFHLGQRPENATKWIKLESVRFMNLFLKRQGTCLSKEVGKLDLVSYFYYVAVGLRYNECRWEVNWLVMFKAKKEWACIGSEALPWKACLLLTSAHTHTHTKKEIERAWCVSKGIRAFLARILDGDMYYHV